METVVRRFMTVADVARALKLTPDGVRWLERTGKLKAIRTEGGMRLFRAEDVHRAATERVARTAKGKVAEQEG